MKDSKKPVELTPKEELELLELEKQLQSRIEKIQAPPNYEQKVQEAIQIAKKQNIIPLHQGEQNRRMTMKSSTQKIVGIAAAALIVFTGSVNLSQSFAQSVSAVPLFGSIAKVLQIRQFEDKKEGAEAIIDTPAVQGIDPELEKSLNKKYLEENKALYQQFVKDSGDFTAENGGHLAVGAGFTIKTDTKDILALQRFVTQTQASTDEKVSIDNIDKNKKIIITLPSLFKDESYINVITENIKSQMKEQMANDKEIYYFIKGEKDPQDPAIVHETGLDKISRDQQFYISDKNQLVIVFNKYDVAPGAQGISEFVIPTSAIQNILVSNEYIK